MADVGVLSLQIEANADSAVSSLNNLAGALSRVQKAISNGLNLSGIASQIAVLGKVVDESISGSTFAKITDLANAVKALQKSSSATKKVENAFVIDDSVAGTIESINSGFASTAGNVQTATEALNGFNASLQETQAIMQDTSWTGGWTQFSNVFNTWASMRSSMALGAGEETGLTTTVETGWTAWKDGAIEVEGTVTDAFDSINTRIEGTAQVLLGAGTAAQTFGGEVESAAESARASFSGWRVFDPKTGDFTKPLDDFNREVISARENADTATGSVQSMVETTNTIDSSGIRETSDAIAGLGGSAGNVGALSPQLEEVSDSGHSAASAIETVKNALSSMGNAIKNSSLGHLASQFFRIARYRAIRSVIKSITDGAKEGFENYKKYSEGVGNKFAKELKSVNSQFAVMKNSIGAAIAPALSAAIPIINAITSAATAAINVVNQLISLLTGGSSWSMAVAGTSASANAMASTSVSANAMRNSVDGAARSSKAYEKAMANAEKSAGGAAKKTKDLLADWDELNIIQSTSGGGGGGGGKSLEDALAMFKEMQFDAKLKMFIDTLEEQFGSIWNLVKRIGAALLTWKLSEILTGALGLLAGLASAGLIIGITFDLVSTFDKMYMRTGDAGWLVGDVLSTLLGGFLATKVLTPLLGGEAAKIALPITLAVSAIASVVALIGEKDVSALSKESIVMSILSGLKMGAAVGGLFYLGGYTPGQAVGVGAGAALAWFGASIGIKATANVFDTGEITSETISADLIAALSVGGGLAIMEAATGGTAATIAGVGVGGALLTFGALIAIQAIIASRPKGIQWGNYAATAEEIKAFVESKMFKASPRVQLNLMNTQVESLGTRKQALEAQIRTMLGNFNVISLKLNPAALETVKTDVANFIEEFNATATEEQKTLELAFSLVPVTDSTGKDISTEIAGRSNDRWNTLKTEMAKLGEELTKAYSDAYNENLDETLRNQAQETIEKISSVMTEIATAIANGEAQAKATFAIDKNITNLTRESMEGLIKTYQETKEQLVKDLTSARETAAEGLLAQAYAYEELAQNALERAKGNTADATYQKYAKLAEEARADYEAALKNIKAEVDKAVKETFEDSEGVQKVRDALLGMLKEGFMGVDAVDTVPQIKNTLAGARKELYKQLYLDDEQGMEVFGKNTLKLWLDEMIKGTYGALDAKAILEGISSGLIGYGDVISGDVINALASAIGIPEASPEIQAAWNDLIASLMGSEIDTSGIEKPAEEAASSVKESSSSIQESLEQLSDYQTETVDMSGVKEPMEEAASTAEESSASIKSSVNSLNGMSAGSVDMSALTGSLSSAAASAWASARSIQAAVAAANSGGFGGFLGGNIRTGLTSPMISRPIRAFASGGFPNSGSIFMADENGNIEMKGKMGSQPVVANNNQIISGISKGVATGQEEMNSLMRRQTELLSQLLNKRITAEVKPSSTMGRTTTRSTAMYERVTG